MAAPDIFLRHGEKAVVALVGLICAWIVVSACTTGEVRATGEGQGMTADQIKTEIAFIDDSRPKLDPPVLKPVFDYAGRMKSDLGRSLNGQTQMAWLGAHPDLGPTITGPDGFYYVYECLPPKLMVEDTIGSLAITVSLPESIRNLDRVDDADQVSWTRQAGAQIENHADVVGALVEIDDGTGWKPLNQGKPVTFEQLGTAIPVLGLTDFATYQVRARLIVAASGPHPGAKRSDVLVHAGRWLPVDPEPTEATEVLAFKTLAVTVFLEPTPVSGLEGIKPGELTYAGPWTEPGSAQVSSPIRFQLTKLGPDVENNPEATVTLVKLLRGPDGSQAWTLPHSFTIKPGQLVGAKQVLIEDPLNATRKLKIPVDLDTPFELVKVEKGVERILYWELKPVSRPEGAKGKLFEVRPKTKSTDTATFKNGRTGELLVLSKLERLTPPLGEKVITPEIEPGDEAELFLKDPRGFKPPLLLPNKPIEHQPDTGPLEDLRLKDGQVLAKTDVPYYELPDGRLYFWEPLNGEALVRYKLGIEPPAPRVVVPPPVAPAPDPGVRPRPGDAPPDAPPDLPMPPDFDGMGPDGMPNGLDPAEGPAPAPGTTPRRPRR